MRTHLRREVTPSAVYSADLNKDGDPDLIVSYLSGSIAVYLATTNGNFAAPTTYTLTGSPMNVIATDVNNDGSADLVIQTTSGFTTLLGNGDGTFRTGGSVSVDLTALVVGDFNRDGRADIVLANFPASFSLLLGNGDGTFQSPVAISGTAGSTLLAANDLNGDGTPDLVASGNGGLLVFPGLGNGLFAPALVTSLTTGPIAILIGDVNRDSKPDIVAFDGQNLTVLLGNGNGTFSKESIYTSNSSISALADIDGDGNLDIVFTYSYTEQISVSFGNGDGTFKSPVSLPVYGTGPIALGNFFQNGRASIVSVSGTGLVVDSNVRPSTVSLAVSPNPAAVNQPVTLTAQISPANATGTVTFYNGNQMIGASAIVSGSATFVTSSLSVNRSILSANYSGDSSTNYSESNSVIETVTGASANISLSVSSMTPAYGHPLVLQATLTPPAASGVVTFFAGAQVLGTSRIANGVAALTTSMLAAGAQSLKAVYQGDATYTAGPTSPAIAVRVHALAETSYRYMPTSGTLYAEALATADFNGDGIPDLVVVTNEIQVFLGVGDGTFTPGALLPQGSGGSNYIFTAAAADLNGNGKPDLAVVDMLNKTLTVYLNQGAAGFDTGTMVASATATAISDFDGDGIPDLVLLDPQLNIQLLRGNGDGTFVQMSQTLPAGSNSAFGVTSIVAGDFNGDGKLDIAVSGYSTGALSVFLGNGDATFQTPVNIPVGLATGPVISSDMNGDGIADLVLLTRNSNDAVEFDSLDVLIGQGNGTFQAPVTYSGSLSAMNIAASDFNGDGVQDVVVDYINGSYEPTSFAIFYGKGDGTLNAPVTFPQPVNGLVVADYNGDGRPDLPGLLGALADTITITSSATPSLFDQALTLTATVFPSTVTGTVTFYDGAVVLGNVPVVNGVATLQIQVPVTGLQQITAKYQGDGNYNYAQTAAVPVTISAAAGGMFASAVNYPTGAGPFVAIAGDFNNDGKLDIATANAQDNTVTILWNSGNGVFGTTSTFLVGVKPEAIAAGDFNGDGIPDLVVSNAGSASLSILVSSGGTFVSLGPIQLAFNPLAVVVGDVNGDGKLDIVVGGQNGGVSAIFLGSGNGKFSQLGLPPAFLNAGRQIALADFNGDNNPDILIANDLFLGDGHGNFSESFLYSVGESVLAAADFNHDGKLDLVFATYQSNTLSVSLGNGDGTFQTPLLYPTVGNALYLVTGDFTGDGIPDLALVSDAGGGGIMVGNGDGTFQPEIVFQTGTQPTALAIGDFNNDGRLDLAVANSGSNNVSVLLATPPTCTYTVTPASLLFEQSGGNAAVTVTASAPSCAWSAELIESFNPAIQPPVSGVGSVTVYVPIPFNNSGAPATGVINVANHQIQVTIDQTNQVFADVPVTDYYFDAVDLLSQKGVTSGCGSDDYCPTQDITRAEMAIFIVRSIEGPFPFPYSTAPYFTDVPPGSFGFEYIQKLRDLGITSGCAPTLFCPNDDLTRAEAAVFVIRARYGAATTFPYPTTPYFTDVPAGAFGFEWIQRLKADAITSGCTATTFCPDDLITRGDIAIFIMRGLFNQLLSPSQAEITLVDYDPSSVPSPFFLQGVNTHFDQATTQILAPGLIISSFTVSSPTELSGYATRDPNVPAGPESIIAITGQEVAVGPNLLSLQ